jgi:DNA (cytosine-5)-methyltransferase 1
MYNEIDGYAADWLENLVAGGHIATGPVIRRSIVDLRPADVAGFNQSHFFAGIGVWPYALRAAGWPDDRPVWTGSCPCQPFSGAGKGAGFADDRHLWPVWFRLIRECRPGVILGEQVASPAALAWWDAVSTDLENAGYACAAVDLCAPGVGAPHIRQRLFWMAYTTGGGCQPRRTGETGGWRDAPWIELERLRNAGGMAHAMQSGRPKRRTGAGDGPSSGSGRTGGMAVPNCDGRQTGQSTAAPARHGDTAFADGGVSRMANAMRSELAGRAQQPAWKEQPPFAGSGDAKRPSPVNGFWRDADWLRCTDGRWRPVEPGTFPLAHGVTGRVGKLRAYGNAVCAPLAVEFVKVVMQCI